jgi:hypothetical protein
MSGSGGGGGGGFDSQSDDCESLVIETQLSSPKAAVVAKLSKGDMLDVTTKTMNGSTVVVCLFKGQVAGGLASPRVQRLRECIENGTTFRAEVLSIDAGQVRVRVKAGG